MSASPHPPRSVSVLSDSEERHIDEAALVLLSQGIRSQVVVLDGTLHLLVADSAEHAALQALHRFAEDHRLLRPAPPPRVAFGPTIWGYVLAVAIPAGHSVLRTQEHLVSAGLANSGAILRGELFRTLTAMTLHADFGHALSNAVSWGIFGTLVFRSLGPGMGLGLTLLAGAIANYANAWLRGPGHFSLGASTAVFGAIGILCGLQFAARWRHPLLHGRRRAWLPLGASFGLLAMLGTGGVRTDILAHFLGLVSGAGLGAMSGFWLERPLRGIAQVALGAGSIALLGTAWLLALHR